LITESGLSSPEPSYLFKSRQLIADSVKYSSAPWYLPENTNTR